MPTAGDITITHCYVEAFCLAHTKRLSQNDAPNTAPRRAMAEVREDAALLEIEDIVEPWLDAINKEIQK